MKLYALLVLVLLYAAQLSTAPASNETIEKPTIEAFLAEVNKRLASLYNEEVEAAWLSEGLDPPSDEIEKLRLENATIEILSYLKSIASDVTTFKGMSIARESLRRQLQQIPEVGFEALDEEDLATISGAMTNISDLYNDVRLCTYGVPEQCDLSYVPDVQNILQNSTNMDVLGFYWEELRRQTGVPAREDFDKYIELYRKTASLNGYAKPSDFLYKDFENNSAGVLGLLSGFIKDLQPLFLQFHAYIRGLLRAKYGKELVPQNRPYPQNLAEVFIESAHRAGQPDWNINLPYPNVRLPKILVPNSRITGPNDVLDQALHYFEELDMGELPPDYLRSYFAGQDVNKDATPHCWHKVWKLYGTNYTEMTYCRAVNEETFLNMFEAVSDIYYIHAYQQSQPTLFQAEPTPYFSDGIAKFFSLAASSPMYLILSDLTYPYSDAYSPRINRLFVQALHTVFLLPTLYALERYRVQLLDGEIKLDDNCGYWDLIDIYTGAEAPVQRTNADFDAPVELLMEVKNQYSSQFLSIILQFQLYEHFCESVGQYKPDRVEQYPLDLCELYFTAKIGPTMLEAMSLGSSQPYKHVLQILTGDTELNTSGIRAYFKPLLDWLLTENRKKNIDVGWDKSDRCTPI